MTARVMAALVETRPVAPLRIVDLLGLGPGL